MTKPYRPWRQSLYLLIVIFLHAASFAQAPAVKARTRATASATDPKIAAALREVSPARIQKTIETLVRFGNRNTIGPADAASVQRGFGIGAARAWIKSEFERYSADCGGCLEVKTDEFLQEKADRIPEPVTIVNVYAVLKGTDPQAAKRIYLVTGHYDSRNSDTLNVTDLAPGANDDASGVAVSLECARVLSKHRFPATLIFMAVAGEEQGLNGSRHFAKMAKVEGWQIEGVLNNDIVGGDKSPGQRRDVVRVFSEGVPLAATEAEIRMLRNIGGENDSASRQLARYIAESGRMYLPRTFQPMMMFRRDRYLRGGDHTGFNEQGFAAVRFTEWRENYDRQHQTPRTENGVAYGDMPQHVDYTYVANVARVNAAAMARLASAPAPPAKARVLTKKLENDSSLAWEASPDGLAAGYEVVWRATSAPDWEHAKNVGNATQVTLPFSKDNVIFAIRAVGKDGHKSLAVVPAPER